MGISTLANLVEHIAFLKPVIQDGRISGENCVSPDAFEYEGDVYRWDRVDARVISWYGQVMIYAREGGFTHEDIGGFLTETLDSVAGANEEPVLTDRDCKEFALALKKSSRFSANGDISSEWCRIVAAMTWQNEVPDGFHQVDARIWKDAKILMFWDRRGSKNHSIQAAGAFGIPLDQLKVGFVRNLCLYSVDELGGGASKITDREKADRQALQHILPPGMKGPSPRGVGDDREAKIAGDMPVAQLKSLIQSSEGKVMSIQSLKKAIQEAKRLHPLWLQMCQQALRGEFPVSKLVGDLVTRGYIETADKDASIKFVQAVVDEAKAIRGGKPVEKAIQDLVKAEHFEPGADAEQEICAWLRSQKGS